MDDDSGVKDLVKGISKVVRSKPGKITPLRQNGAPLSYEIGNSSD